MNKDPVGVLVLGPWQVLGGNGPVAFPAGQMRVLLAVLLLSAGRPVAAEVLGERLWPERMPVRVQATVHTYVARLRRLLGRDIIETTRDGYLLPAATCSADLWQFRDLVSRAAAAAPVAAELALLREALDLWRGRPFTGVESTWLDRQIVPRLEEEWFAAVERRLELELRIGRAGDLVPQLRELVGTYPTRESLWQRLIEALHRSGRRAEALDAYRQVRSHLVEGFGIEPGDAIQSLHRQVLLDGAAACDPVRPPAPRREATRQLRHDVLRSTSRVELAQLDRWLRRVSEPDGQRLSHIVVIDGAAGIGKSGLAVHWAHRIGPAYPDIQLHLDLRGHRPGGPLSPAAAVAALLRGLGVPSDAIPPGLDERSARLRGTLSGRRALVLLDDARTADQVRPLLPGADSLVIVTSRHQLRELCVHDGAHRVTLGPLPSREAFAVLSNALGAEQVAAEPDAALRLVELCDGLPLALAIAAERAQAAGGLTRLVQALVDERAEAHLFGDGSGDPQADLWTSLACSYHTLSPEAATMFRALPRHPTHDITLPAAAALAGTTVGNAWQALDQLVGIHLLQRGPHGYRLDRLVRWYAAALATPIRPAEPTAVHGRPPIGPAPGGSNVHPQRTVLAAAT